MKRPVLLLFCSFCATVAICGCGGGGGAPSSGANWVIGKWSADAFSLTLDGSRYALHVYGMVGLFEVSQDGTYLAYEYDPGQGERCSAGRWEQRGGDAWVFSNTSDGRTSMLFRQGGELYKTGLVGSQQVWIWYRPDTSAIPICPPTGPTAITSRLFQAAPGETSVIRTSLSGLTPPADRNVLGWLFYRASSSGSVFDDESLVGWVRGESLPGGVWDDSGRPGSPQIVSEDIRYSTTAGTIGSVHVEATVTSPTISAGERHRHRVRWVTEVATGIPAAGAGFPPSGEPVMLAQSLLHVQPPEALAPFSNPTAPLTYIIPPVLHEPSDGAQNQSTESLTFAWSATAGADQYVLQVFAADDPDGVRTPLHSVPVNDTAGGALSRTINGPFASSTGFYWRVGARRSGEPLPENGQLNQRGWLFSNIRYLRTTLAPPTPPTPPTPPPPF